MKECVALPIHESPMLRFMYSVYVLEYFGTRVCLYPAPRSLSYQVYTVAEMITPYPARSPAKPLAGPQILCLRCLGLVG